MRKALFFVILLCGVNFSTQLAGILTVSHAEARDIILGENGQNDVSEAERDRRNLAETNGIADVVCQGIALAQSDITKIIVSIVLIVMGYGAYIGKTTIGLLVSFAIGAVIMFSVVNVFILITPYTDIREGCECKQYLVLKTDKDGNRTLMKTNLNKDCTKIGGITPPVTPGGGGEPVRRCASCMVGTVPMLGSGCTVLSQYKYLCLGLDAESKFKSCLTSNGGSEVTDVESVPPAGGGGNPYFICIDSVSAEYKRDGSAYSSSSLEDESKKYYQLTDDRPADEMGEANY